MKQTRVKVLKEKKEPDPMPEPVQEPEPVIIVPEPVQEAPIKKKNQWIDHVKDVAKTKNITYRESLKIAGQTYKK